MYKPSGSNWWLLLDTDTLILVREARYNYVYAFMKKEKWTPRVGSATTMCTPPTNTVVQVRDKKETTIDVQNTSVPCTLIRWSALHMSKCFQELQQQGQKGTARRPREHMDQMSLHGGRFWIFHWVHVALPTYTGYYSYRIKAIQHTSFYSAWMKNLNLAYCSLQTLHIWC